MFAPQLVKIAGRAGLAAGVLGASLAAAQPTFAQGLPIPVETVRVAQTPNSDNTPAKIKGTVTDPQGAVIPFAVISITNKENGDFRAMNADAEGAYEFLDLPTGRYSMKFEAVGFETFEHPEISVSEGSQLRQNAGLGIPQIGEIVQVGGEEGVQTVWLGGLIATTVSGNPLVLAVMNDDLEEVKVRIAMRDRVNVRDKAYDGLSPLHAAAQNGNVEIARFLLEHGAKVNIRDHEKRTPMMLLDEDATPEIVQLLINYGAKAKLLDKEKNSALHHLAQSGADPEILRMLVNYGYKANAVNKEGKTPLMIAAESEKEDNVSALLQTGADPNVRTRDGRSAIDFSGSEAVRSTLQTYGAIAKQ
jgi:hypothetical protein